MALAVVFSIISIKVLSGNKMRTSEKVLLTIGS